MNEVVEQPKNMAISQAQKKRNTYDMMVSMHYKLRDNYNKWSVFFDCIEILASVMLCGVTFYPFQEKATKLIGIVAIVIFALTLIKQRLNLKKKAEKHQLAGKLYLNAKLDLEWKIGVWEKEDAQIDEILTYIRDKYKELSEVTSIPEKKFHKLKHHHQAKVEFSKFLDNNKATPWIMCKIKFAFQHKPSEDKSSVKR